MKLLTYRALAQNLKTLNDAQLDLPVTVEMSVSTEIFSVDSIRIVLDDNDVVDRGNVILTVNEVNQ